MTKPAWSDPAANPFALFGAPAGAGAAAQPLTQGLAGGMDLFKKFWSNLPGGATIPGFLVPTLDVEELDKRLSDLRAAQQWLEVNLNVLRATIQGLEVQRNTIAAIQSLSAMRENTSTPVTGGLPAGWPMSQSSATSPPPAAAAATSPASSPKTPVDPVASAAPTGDGAERPGDEASAGANGEATDAPPAAPALAGLAASNWLGFMQDQFAKVAQAALAPGAFDAGAVAPAPSASKAPKKAVAKKAVAKKSARRKPTARKPA